MTILLVLGAILNIVLSERSYVIIQQKKTFADAQKYCQLIYGTSLASLREPIDLEALTDAEGSGASYAVWMGLIQKPNTGAGKKRSDYRYIDGSGSTYVPWAPNEPNNAGGKENCGELQANGLMNDLNCYKKRYFVCNARRKFYVVKIQKTKAQAELYCHDKFGEHLASIRNVEESKRIGKKCSSCWIGLREKIGVKEGKKASEWRFSDNTEYSNFNYWNPGEPNNAGGKENCGEIYANGKWNDVPCSKKKSFVCNSGEYDSLPLKVTIAANNNNLNLFTPSNININKIFKNGAIFGALFGIGICGIVMSFIFMCYAITKCCSIKKNSTYAKVTTADSSDDDRV